MFRLSFMLLLLPTIAVGQIAVPYECIELAKREGYPTDTLTKAQAAKAKVKLYRLSDNDPIVRACRAAITRNK